MSGEVARIDAGGGGGGGGVKAEELNKIRANRVCPASDSVTACALAPKASEESVSPTLSAPGARQTTSVNEAGAAAAEEALFNGEGGIKAD